MILNDGPEHVPSALIELPAARPDDVGERWAVYFRRDLAIHLEANGPGWKFFNLPLMMEALEIPSAVFAGLDRPGLTDAICYSRSLSVWYVSEGYHVAVRERIVCLVFVCRGRMPIVLDYERRPEDPRHPGHPLGWEKDFTSRLWPPPTS